MKKIKLILGIVISLVLAPHTAEASFTKLANLNTLIVDEENDIYVWEITSPPVSYYESRATVTLATFNGTAIPQESIKSGNFNMPSTLKVYFNYVSPQKYDVDFCVRFQRYDTIKGWIDLTTNNFIAKSTTKSYGYGVYSSNTKGPFRIVVETPDVWGVKITNSSVTYEK